MSSIFIYSSRFSRKNNPKNFYVYAYVDANGYPYYIGKGSKSRAWALHDNIEVPCSERIVVLESNLTEIGAWAIERRLIAWFGKVDNGTGILYNRANGGCNSHGVKNTYRSEQHRQKISNTLKAKNRKSQIQNGGTFDRKWITNGTQNKCILPSENCPIGWTYGITRDQNGKNNSVFGKVKYNNGYICKYFLPGEEPDGWIKGKIQSK